MIPTYSTTIRRKEMDAVLTCMVDEKIGPGELNGKLIQQVKEFIKCDGAVALRSPSIALKYALKSLDFESGRKIMISALAPAWQYQTVSSMGFEPLVLDVDESTGLVSVEIVEEGIKEGGSLLLLHETEGIVPDLQGICALGIPVIEDISQSAGACVMQKDENGQTTEERVQAGTFGVFTILGLEERDVITAGGGAILIAPGRREWIVLKHIMENVPVTDLLPDINCALAWVQVKEYPRNEATRKEIFSLYQRACMVGRHKMYARESDEGSTASCFPLVLNSSFKDVKQYTAKKDIEIQPAYEGSVIAMEDSLSEKCIHAKSLLLRCVHIPLYPRLTHAESAKIVKVLGSLP
ncbi:MAG: DegT/DnrJ/EryC1/StrS aminotransferase family protein [Treponema sp.]|nr:DegT/DnrJ/EryC1/StrS aminotransferase family protein [Treponema sp.]